MSGVWRLQTRSATPIVSLGEAKRQTNTLDFADDDALLTSLLDVATHRFDLEAGIIGRPLLTQEWQFTAPDSARYEPARQPYLRGMSGASGFLFDRAPIQSIVKIEALQNGAYIEMTLADFVLRPLCAEASLLRMAAGRDWPSVDDDEAAWRLTLRLGYGDAPADVPAPIRQAALLLIGHMYQNREAVAVAQLSEIPFGVRALVAPYMAPNT